MKKLILLAILLLQHCLVFSQIYPVRAQLQDSGSFSMIVIPDPQSYIKFAANQPLFDLQTAWVANHIETLQIKTLLCTGDLVEQNEIRIPDKVNGDQTSEEQWTAVSDAFRCLDGKLPYVLCTGNHDYGYKASEIRMTNFNRYFPVERNSCWKTSLVATGLNYEQKPTLENAAYELQTEHWGNLLIVSLEFAPRDEAIAWAKELIQSDRYKHHQVIILTHSFLDTKGERFKKEGYKMQPVNYAEALWEKLIYPSDNIKLVVCGHACTIGDYQEQVSFRSDKNHLGKPVAQMMFNAQTADKQWFGNGGDCWLRILEFKPDGKTISVRTFSPLFALSPLTKDKAWRTAIYDQFNIIME